MVKILRAVWETWVRSLGREDPLEKQMAIQYSLLENSVGRGAGRLQSMESQNWTQLRK